MERSQNMENDKTYLLNIQQQVRKNQIEIELLKSGIKIVGAGETLPASANEGDCYLLGTEGDYELNAYINGNWIPLGSFPAVGPQGVPGVKGDPAVISYITCAAHAIDYGLAPHVSASVNGETVSFDFELPGGPRGLQGPKGEKGDKGDQGNVGPQGPQGEPGNSIRLYQNPSVVTASDLPAASVVGPGVGYLVGTLQDGYELYATANDPLEWVDAGPFIPAQVIVDPKLDRLSDNAVQNKPVAKAIGMPATFATTDELEQGLDLSDDFWDIWTSGYPFSAVDGGTRYKYLSFKEVIGSGGTYNRTYDYISLSHNADGLGVSFAKITTNSVGLSYEAAVESAGTFVVPKRSELVSAKNSLNAEIARSKAADNLHQKEITLLKNLVYDTVAASFSYSQDYAFWMDVPASVEISGSYHEVLDDAAAQIEVIEGTSAGHNQLASKKSMSFTAGEDAYEPAQSSTSYVAGHKYIVFYNQSADVPTSGRNAFFLDAGGLQAVTGKFTVNEGNAQFAGNDDQNATKGFKYAILTCTSSFAGYFIYWVNGISVSFGLSDISIIDLTHDFPTDTPTTLDDPRIQAILFTPDLGYDAGSIKSSIVDKVISHGFNLWDEVATSGGFIDPDGEIVTGYNTIASTNKIRVEPGKTYIIKISYRVSDYGLTIAYYDANGSFIERKTIYDDALTIPQGVYFIRFGTNSVYGSTYNHNICISKYNVSLYGQYKPWVAPMSVNLEALGVTLEKRTLRSAYTTRDSIYASLRPDELYELRKIKAIGARTITSVENGYSGNVNFNGYVTLSDAAEGSYIVFGNWEASTVNNIYSYDVTGFSADIGAPKALMISASGCTTLEQLNAYLSAHPLQIVYVLATPVDELLADNLTFGDIELLIEKGGYLSIDNENERYGAVPGITVDLPILRYE